VSRSKKRQKPGQIVAASYFDVDGTLVRTNLIQPTVFYLLNQRTISQKVGRLLRAALQAPRMALAELQDRRLFNEVLFQAYEGTSLDRLHILAEECFDSVIKPAIFPFADRKSTRLNSSHRL